MILWSPSSWELWKTCPAKYRIKKVERWQRLGAKRDTHHAKFAVPGLVVDKVLQLWFHRNQFDDRKWLAENFQMVWSMVENEIMPKWESTLEIESVREETIRGIQTAVRMIEELDLDRYELLIQPSFSQQITEEFAITGAADLLLIERGSWNSIIIDFKNAHRRENITKDQLLIYQMGLGREKGLNVIKSGYLLYNPRLEQWKWFKMNGEHEQRLIEKLKLATKEVQDSKFPFKWNHYSCTRFCDVRYSCEMFKLLVGDKSKSRITWPERIQ